ncbi:carbohydrate kinase family protein [Chloroflexota bacterium]
MASIDIVGFGAMNIDHLYRVDELVVDGEQLVGGIESLPGGSAANTVYGLAKLGVKAGFVGAVGSDDVGGQLIKDFKAVAVDTSQIRIKQEERTGATICLSDKMGGRGIYVSPGANDLLGPEDMDLAYLNRAQMVHLSSFADDRQFKLQVNVTEKLSTSVTVSLAPGMFYVSRGLKALVPLLKRAHIVFMNREEIEQLTGEGFKTGAKKLVKSGCRVVVVTLGKGIAKGKGTMVTAYIYDGEKEYEVESEKISPKSTLETTGAGDAFAAGFLFGFLKGKGLEECGLLGDIMSGFAIKEVGARKGLPSLAQLSQKYLQRSGNPL